MPRLAARSDAHRRMDHTCGRGRWIWWRNRIRESVSAPVGCRAAGTGWPHNIHRRWFMPRKISRPVPSGSSVAASVKVDDARPSAVVSTDAGVEAAVQDELLNFDVEDDSIALVPMPSTIPDHVRAAITTAVGERFTYAADLDEWLHAPHDALVGRTPFECIVDGDGPAVLAALLGESIARASDRPITAGSGAGGQPRVMLPPRRSDCSATAA